ncbi:hypothetical protein Ocepr_2239 [Oceanithermus profundus DSM 14977]|uniref:Tetratricopeptide repeat protein n=1 Tax=Oceanithermus profundus (strain DSM 14977 / NBRC 100410 / VKM B-2274 / 506) TaxID=670487 RepID=E4U5F5_OCEP5|nr:hypothetical protein Ocepr_2239 [Oceanithermus profundus DSM 14977]
MEGLSVELLGRTPELPPSPGAELAIYLLARPGWRSREELEKVIPELDRALEQVRASRYGPYLEEADGRFQLRAESDVLAYWQDAYRDWAGTAERYGELAAGFSSAIPAFQEWLEAERREVLHALWGTAVGKAGALLDQGAKEAALALVAGAEAAYPLEPASALDLADFYWRARRPADTARVIEAVLEAIPEKFRDRARLNLAAARLRAGDEAAAQAELRALEAEGGELGVWAGVHRGSHAVLTGDAELALRLAEEAFAAAEEATDGELAIAALMLKGEALTALGRPKEATHALGEALGIHEVMGRSFSPVVLALLAEAHAAWGYADKARELAEKAFKEARAQRDPYAASRALWALFRATGEAGYAEMARREAAEAGHAPWQRRLEELAEA